MARIINFPTEWPLGVLYVRRLDTENWRYWSLAQGDVLVNEDCLYKLKVSLPLCKRERSALHADYKIEYLTATAAVAENFPIHELDFSNLGGDYNGATIDEVISIKNVDKIIMDGVSLSEAGLYKIISKSGLQHLSVSHSFIVDDGVMHSDHSANLLSLNLDSSVFPEKFFRRSFLPDSLQRLDVSSTNISAEDVKVFGNLPCIEHLAMAGTKINQAAINHLANIFTLRSIDLGGTDIGNKDVAHLLSNLPLTSIILANTLVDDAALSSANDNQCLQILNLCSTGITDRSIPFINKRQTIEKLYLAGTQVSDNGIKMLDRVDQIVEIDLDSTEITDLSIETISRWTAITNVSIQDTNTTGIALSYLSRIATIDSISMDGTSLFGPLTIVEDAFCSLTKFTGYGTKMSDFCWLNNARKLKCLILGNTAFNDDHSLMLADMQLIELVLSDTYITDRSIAHISAIQSLEHLWLDGCKVTDESLLHLAYLTHLDFLDLVGCDVSENKVQSLDSQLPICCIVV